MAKQLGHTNVASLLQETLEEEKQTDQKLNQVALGLANPQAAEQASSGAQRGRRSSPRASPSPHPRQSASDESTPRRWPSQSQCPPCSSTLASWPMSGGRPVRL